MFSRFRMSLIVEIQGVRLGLAAADSGLRCGAALVVVEGRERKTLRNLNYGSWR